MFYLWFTTKFSQSTVKKKKDPIILVSKIVKENSFIRINENVGKQSYKYSMKMWPKWIKMLKDSK